VPAERMKAGQHRVPLSLRVVVIITETAANSSQRLCVGGGPGARLPAARIRGKMAATEGRCYRRKTETAVAQLRMGRLIPDSERRNRFPFDTRMIRRRSRSTMGELNDIASCRRRGCYPGRGEQIGFAEAVEATRPEPNGWLRFSAFR